MEMPKYLFSKRFLTMSVVIIFLFSIPFLLIYKPFSATIWIGIKPLNNLLFTIIFYVIVIALMALSKIAMYHFQSMSHALTPGRFAAWIMAEFLMIALVYLALTPVVTGDTMQIHFPVVLKASLCVGLILAIPYGYMSILAANRALREEYEALKASVSSVSPEVQSHVMFYDYKGNPSISLDVDAIQYIEAQDNYVQIYYQSEGRQHRYMLRCPTQKIETLIEDTTLVRCHRSYIVNLCHLEQFVRDKKAAYIILKGLDKKEISVSKSYYKNTLERLLVINPSAQVIKHTKNA